MCSNIFFEGKWQKYCRTCNELAYECTCENKKNSDSEISKSTEKMQRKIGEYPSCQRCVHCKKYNLKDKIAYCSLSKDYIKDKSDKKCNEFVVFDK